MLKDKSDPYRRKDEGKYFDMVCSCSRESD